MLTLDELMGTFEKILESRLDEMEFSAKLQGVDIKRPQVKQEESEKVESFNDRIRARLDAERVKAGGEVNKSRKFSDGVGYQVIGG